MNELQIFNNEQFGEVRIVIKNSEPWFVGKDVAVALGYAKPENALATHVDLEDKTSTLIQGSGSNYKSKVVLINESGLYALVFGSKLEKAKEFKRWVTSEVLPTLRKTGEYKVKESNKMKEMLAEAKMRNARAREAEKWLKLANLAKTEISKEICCAYTSQVLTGGEFALPLPRTQRTYSAGDIAAKLGITAKKVGMVAKAHNLKTGVYGEWVNDKSKYSAHEEPTFRYYENVIPEIRRIIEQEVA